MATETARSRRGLAERMTSRVSRRTQLTSCGHEGPDVIDLDTPVLTRKSQRVGCQQTVHVIYDHILATLQAEVVRGQPSNSEPRSLGRCRSIGRGLGPESPCLGDRTRPSRTLGAAGLAGPYRETGRRLHRLSAGPFVRCGCGSTGRLPTCRRRATLDAGTLAPRRPARTKPNG